MSWRSKPIIAEGAQPASAALSEAAERYRADCDKARVRAAKFGLPYKPPPAARTLTDTEAKRLVLQKEPGTATGWDVSTSEEETKRSSRAARFEIPVFSYSAEAASNAGLSEAEVKMRQLRRERAARFGKADELDVAIASAALEALGEHVEPGAAAAAAASAATSSVASSVAAVMSVEEALSGAAADEVLPPPVAAPASSAEGPPSSSSSAAAAAVDDTAASAAPPTVREDAVHIRALNYLPAASADLLRYFSENTQTAPAFIEWLNGCSANVLFEDAWTARRALLSLTEPIPVVPGVPRVHPAWRVALKPLVKQRTDKYAPAGTLVTIYARAATTDDVKGKAGRTRGARSQGTFSKSGEYSAAQAPAEDDLSALAPARVTAHVAAVLKAAVEDLSGGGGSSAASAAAAAPVPRGSSWGAGGGGKRKRLAAGTADDAAAVDADGSGGGAGSGGKRQRGGSAAAMEEDDGAAAQGGGEDKAQEGEAEGERDERRARKLGQGSGEQQPVGVVFKGRGKRTRVVAAAGMRLMGTGAAGSPAPAAAPGGAASSSSGEGRQRLFTSSARAALQQQPKTEASKAAVASDDVEIADSTGEEAAGVAPPAGPAAAPAALDAIQLADAAAAEADRLLQELASDL